MIIALNTTDRNLANDLKSIKIDGLTVRPRFTFNDSGSVPVMSDGIWEFTIICAGNLTIALFANWLYDKIKHNPKEKTTINGQIISGENIQSIQIQQIIINNIMIQNKDESKPDPK